LESNRPIIVGVAQYSDPDVTLETALDPVEMISRVARDAAASTGADPSLVEKLDTIGLAAVIAWEPRNAPRLVADALGARPSTEWQSHNGGESALALVNRAASRIAAGESELAFVGGCNNIRAYQLARRAGRAKFDWPMGGEGEPIRVGTLGDGSDAAEAAVGLAMPIHFYPIFENALRAARGLSIEEHRRAMGALFEPFTKVAANNPYAWFPTERSAAELAEPSADNRFICFPYTKYLNAVIETDQAAGALVTSEAMAKRLGIPEESWIHWRGGAVEVEEPWLVTHRPSFSECPAMRTCHATALANSGLALDEIDLIDLYSCFPSAVTMACEMVGLAPDDPRGLTLTGGLPYAGGPGNSYCFHSLAAAVSRLREKAGEHALVTGNGWYLTKHSATILSRRPATTDAPSAAAATDATRSSWSAPPVELVAEASGDATVETYTIVHGRDGAPEKGIIVGRLAETGQRFLANTPPDPTLLADLEKMELIGTRGSVRHEDGRNVYDPA
jgi:acetyl-CoA C-acetyltransferase